MNEETRKLFSDLGSKNVKDLAFRDSWVFVGAKGVQNKSPFEQVWVNSLPPLLPSPEQLACPFRLHPVRSPSAHAAAFPEFSPSTPTQAALAPSRSAQGGAVTDFPILYGFHPKRSLYDKAFTLARFTTKKLFSQTSSRYPVLSLQNPAPRFNLRAPFPPALAPSGRPLLWGRTSQAPCEGLARQP